MNPQLEHANISVGDIDALIHFLTTAMPELKVRHDGVNAGGDRWVHLGTEQAYIAINAANDATASNFVPYGGKRGINHLGWVVSDAEGVRERLSAAGYRDSTYPNAHPHRNRVYFEDAEGNDWEFVEYFSSDSALRNDYALSDQA